MQQTQQRLVAVKQEKDTSHSSAQQAVAHQREGQQGEDEYEAAGTGGGARAEEEDGEGAGLGAQGEGGRRSWEPWAPLDYRPAQTLARVPWSHAKPFAELRMVRAEDRCTASLLGVEIHKLGFSNWLERASHLLEKSHLQLQLSAFSSKRSSPGKNLPTPIKCCCMMCHKEMELNDRNKRNQVLIEEKKTQFEALRTLCTSGFNGLLSCSTVGLPMSATDQSSKTTDSVKSGAALQSVEPGSCPHMPEATQCENTRDNENLSRKRKNDKPYNAPVESHALKPRQNVENSSTLIDTTKTASVTPTAASICEVTDVAAPPAKKHRLRKHNTPVEPIAVIPPPVEESEHPKSSQAKKASSVPEEKAKNRGNREPTANKEDLQQDEIKVGGKTTRTHKKDLKPARTKKEEKLPKPEPKQRLRGKPPVAKKEDDEARTEASKQREDIPKKVTEASSEGKTDGKSDATNDPSRVQHTSKEEPAKQEVMSDGIKPTVEQAHKSSESVPEKSITAPNGSTAGGKEENVTETDPKAGKEQTDSSDSHKGLGTVVPPAKEEEPKKPQEAVPKETTEEESVKTSKRTASKKPLPAPESGTQQTHPITGKPPSAEPSKDEEASKVKHTKKGNKDTDPKKTTDAQPEEPPKKRGRKAPAAAKNTATQEPPHTKAPKPTKTTTKRAPTRAAKSTKATQSRGGTASGTSRTRNPEKQEALLALLGGGFQIPSLKKN